MDSDNLGKARPAGLIEDLTDPATGTRIGYRLVGNWRGPQLVVAGHGALADRVFERILAIPTLPWIRGRLVMVRLDAIGEYAGSLELLHPLGEVDRTLMLPFASSEHFAVDVREGYQSVLRAAAELGMIRGRGVS